MPPSPRTVYVEAEHPRASDGKFKDKHKPQRGRPDMAPPAEQPHASTARAWPGAATPWPTAERPVCDNTPWSDPDKDAIWARWEVELRDSDLTSADIARIGYSIAGCYARVDLQGCWRSPEQRESAIEDGADVFASELEDAPLPAVGTGQRLPHAISRMVHAVRDALPEGQSIPDASIVSWQETKLFTALSSMASEHGTRDPRGWQHDRSVLDGYRACREALSDYNPPPKRRQVEPGESTLDAGWRIRTAEVTAEEEAEWLAEGEKNLDAWVERGSLRNLGLSESVGAFLAHRVTRTARMEAGRLAAGGGYPGVNETAEELTADAPEALEATRDSWHERKAGVAAGGVFRKVWLSSDDLVPGHRLESAIQNAAVAAADVLHDSGLYDPKGWPWSYRYVNRAHTGLAALFANHNPDELERLFGDSLIAADANDGQRSAPAAFFVAADDYTQSMGFSARLPDWRRTTFAHQLTVPARSADG